MRSVFRTRRVETYSSFSLQRPRTTPTISSSTLPRPVPSHQPQTANCNRATTVASLPTTKRAFTRQIEALGPQQCTPFQHYWLVTRNSCLTLTRLTAHV